jgi:hypothetical protein
MLLSYSSAIGMDSLHKGENDPNYDPNEDLLLVLLGNLDAKQLTLAV